MIFEQEWALGLYMRIALLALLPSLFFPLSLLVTNSVPGTTMGAVLGLVLHVVAWVAIVPALTRAAGRLRSGPRVGVTAAYARR